MWMTAGSGTQSAQIFFFCYSDQKTAWPRCPSLLHAKSCLDPPPPTTRIHLRTSAQSGNVRLNVSTFPIYNTFNFFIVFLATSVFWNLELIFFCLGRSAYRPLARCTERERCWGLRTLVFAVFPVVKLHFHQRQNILEYWSVIFLDNGMPVDG